MEELRAPVDPDSVRTLAMELERAPKLWVFPPARVVALLEKKCWLLAVADRKPVGFAARLPRLACVCATGRVPRITLPLRIMLSLTGMERPMRPLANSCVETFLTAPRMRASVITCARFEP